MSIKITIHDNEVMQEAEANEGDARAEVKEARNNLKTKRKEKKSLVKENEEKLAEKDGEIATANRNLKAAIARRKAATQTRLASEGKDPEPKKVGNESLCLERATDSCIFGPPLNSSNVLRLNIQLLQDLLRPKNQ